MKMFELIAIEARRSWLHYKVYYFEVIADWAFMTISFLVLVLLFEVSTAYAYDQDSRLALILGYFIWRVAGGIMVEVTRSINEDAQFGTLEQIFLNGVSVTKILLARSINFGIYYTLRLAVLFLIFLPFLVDDLSGFTLWVFGLYLLTLVAPVGLALMLAGLHLVYKNLHDVTFAIATALLLLSGAVSSLASNPYLFGLSRILPLGIGIDLIKAAVVKNQMPPLYSADLTSVIGLVLISSIYVLIGILAIYIAQKVALKQGSLAQY